MVQELREIFDTAPLAPALRAKVEQVIDPKRKPIDDDCPICYSEVCSTVASY